MKPGDIHWVELPPSVGHEQVGRRPAIILQDDSYAGGVPLVIVIPLTGAIAASRFAGTLVLEPSAMNGLPKTSVALVFQVRAIDRNTVRERIGAADADTIVSIHALLDRLTGRPRDKA